MDLSIQDLISLGLIGNIPKESYLPDMMISGKQVFPTNHPYTNNGDGSVSNVKTGVFGFDTPSGYREVVIPTFVDGRQLSDDEARSVASNFGIEKYPQFKAEDIDRAINFSRYVHALVDEKGRAKGYKK